MFNKIGYKVSLITMILTTFLIWFVNADVSWITNSSAVATPALIAGSCDEVETMEVYIWEYWVIFDKFFHTLSWPVYLWWAYFADIVNNGTDWSSLCLFNNSQYTTWDYRFLNFNSPYLTSIWWRINPWARVRHLTTSQEYGIGYQFGVWTMSWSYTDTDTPWVFNFNQWNVRNPLNHPASITTWSSFDCQIKIWTIYDIDNNDTTISDNRMLIQCNNIQIRWCGDWVADSSHGEQCDDNNQISWDGCSSTCILEAPTCTITATPSSWTAPLTTSFTATKLAWNSYSWLNLWDWTYVANPVFPISHTYVASSVYTVTLELTNNYTWAIWTGYSLTAWSCVTSVSSSSAVSWWWWGWWWGWGGGWWWWGWGGDWWWGWWWWGGWDDWWPIFADSPNCEYVDPPSVQVWEHLPIWWKLKEWIWATSCDWSNSWMYNRDTTRCTFEIRNWLWESQKFTKPCFVNEWSDLADWYLADYGLTINYDWRLNYYVDPILFNWLWEYKAILKKVDYSVCNWSSWVSWVYDWTVCEMNFSVTRPYLLQKWATLSTVNNDVLSNFYEIDWTPIISNDEIDKITVSTYTWWENISFILSDFITKYEKLAVKPEWNADLNLVVNVYKVPNKRIYIMDAWWQTVQLKSNAKISTPLTLVIKNWNLRIRDNLVWKWLFIVPNWVVDFQSNNCDLRQEVDGIFVAQWYQSDKILNGDLNNSNWCKDWRLKINWILVGDDLRSLWENKRSVLLGFFNISDSSQRKDKLYDWASLLMQTNTDIWLDLPPWAWELMESLKIEKR